MFFVFLTEGFNMVGESSLDRFTNRVPLTAAGLQSVVEQGLTSVHGGLSAVCIEIYAKIWCVSIFLCTKFCSGLLKTRVSVFDRFQRL